MKEEKSGNKKNRKCERKTERINEGRKTGE